MTLYKEGDKVRYNGREYEIVNVTPTTYDLDSPDYYQDGIPEDELEYVPEPGSVAETEAKLKKLTKTERIERLEKVVGLLCDESQQDFVMNRRVHVDDIPRLQSKVEKLSSDAEQNSYYSQNLSDQLKKLQETVLEIERRLQDIEQESANKAASTKTDPHITGWSAVNTNEELSKVFAKLGESLIKSARNNRF